MQSSSDETSQRGSHFPIWRFYHPSNNYIFFILKKASCRLRNRQLQQGIPAFHAISIFLCSNCSRKRASTKLIEAVFYTSGTELAVLLWEGSAALTVVKRDEREGV